MNLTKEEQEHEARFKFGPNLEDWWAPLDESKYPGLGHYDICADGYVLNRKTGNRGYGSEGPCGNTGYRQIYVGLSYVDKAIYGKQKSFSLARLLAQHFLPSPESEDDQVDHIDRNPLNNDPSNLRWATASQNQVNRKKMKTRADTVDPNNVHCVEKNIHYNVAAPRTHWYFTIVKTKAGADYFCKTFLTQEDAIIFKYKYIADHKLPLDYLSFKTVEESLASMRASDKPAK